MKKITFYLKGLSKPLVLTDVTNNDEKILIQKVKDVFLSDKICTFQTNNDYLISRSSEIQAILISDNEFCKNNKDNNEEINESKNIKKEIKIVTPKVLKPENKKEIQKTFEIKEKSEPVSEPIKKEIKQTQNITNNKKVMSLDELHKQIENNKKKELEAIEENLKTYDKLSFEEDVLR